MAWFLEGILHVESGVGVLFEWPCFIKDQVLWTECLSCNQDLRKETLHFTWTGRGRGHSWKNSSVPVFLSHVHQQWENKREKHPFISSRWTEISILWLGWILNALISSVISYAIFWPVWHFYCIISLRQKKEAKTKITGLFFKVSIQRGKWIHNIYLRLRQKARGLHTFVCVQKIDS